MDELLSSPPPLDAITRTEFEDDFIAAPSFYATARKRAKHGLRSSSLRSVHWRLFLDLLDTDDIHRWPTQLEEQRKEYEELLSQYKVTPSINHDAYHDNNNDREEQQHEQTTPPNSTRAVDDPYHHHVNSRVSYVLPSIIIPAQQSSTTFRSPSPLSSSSTSSNPSSPMLIAGVTTNDLKINNPLSTASTSPWNQYFITSELCQLITQDLKRTFADNQFFQSDNIQELMLNVLLVWAKLHPLYEYRQGFNEILAPLVYVVFKDTRSYHTNNDRENSPSPLSDNSTTAILSTILDRRYAEHDIFAMFSKIMNTMSPYFAKIDNSAINNGNNSNNSGINSATNVVMKLIPLSKRLKDADDLLLIPSEPASPSSHDTDDESRSIAQSPILSKCHYIHHILLAHCDPALYKHLQQHDVQPQLYGLRWYRLLFAREFHIADVCIIWDVLFSVSSPSIIQQSRMQNNTAYSNDTNSTTNSPTSNSNNNGGFVLADYMCISMLYYVRSQLLSGDNAFCLKRLLKFPPVEDIRVLLDRALYFRDAHQTYIATHKDKDKEQQHHQHQHRRHHSKDVLNNAQQQHMDNQEFIQEYTQQVLDESSSLYLEDPLGLKKKANRAILHAGGITNTTNINTSHISSNTTEIKKEKKNSNKVQTAASHDTLKPKRNSISSIGSISVPAPIQHSASLSNISPTLSTATINAPIAPSSSPLTAPRSHSSLSNTPPITTTTTATTASISIPSTSTSMIDPPHQIRHLNNIMHDMSDELQTIINRLKKEYDRIQQSSPNQQQTHHHHNKAISTHYEQNGIMEPMSDPRAQHHPLSRSSSSSSSSTGNTAAPTIDLSIFSNSLSDLQHIQGVLCGRIRYTPHNEDELISIEKDSQSTASQLSSLSSSLSSSSSHIFFAPPSVESAKDRLARLLWEAEQQKQTQQRDTQQHQQQQPSPPTRSWSSSTSSSLSTRKKSNDRLTVNISKSSYPAIMSHQPSSSTPATPTPSLFEYPTMTTQPSVAGVLSSLLAQEKKSVFNDD